MDELVLRPSRMVYRLGAAFAVLFGLIGAALLVAGRLLGIFPLVIAAISAFASVSSLIPGVAHLKLDERGYELKSIKHRFRIDWTEVTGFSDTWLGTGGRYKAHVVQAHFGEGYAEMHMPSSRLTDGLIGVDQRYVPASYGNTSAPELAALLEQWRVKHSWAA